MIGYGSANQGTSKVHGSPLGKEDGKSAKLSYGFDHEDFFVPEDVYEDFQKNVFNRGKRAFNKWKKMIREYKKTYPELYKELADDVKGQYLSLIHISADSAGINVYKMRYAGTLISGFLAGIGGLIFVIPTSTNFRCV